MRVCLLSSDHLASAQRKAEEDKSEAGGRFQKWASQFVEDAEDMNVNSGAQIRTLFFAGVRNRIANKGCVELEKTFKVQRLLKLLGTSWGCGTCAVHVYFLSSPSLWVYSKQRKEETSHPKEQVLANQRG